MAQMNETNEEIKPGKQDASFGWDPIEELQLQVNKNDKDDYEEIVKLLTQVLTFPSTQAAQLHMNANRLGTRDLRKSKQEMEEEKAKGQSEMGDQPQYCSCCGFVKQDDQLKLCTRLSQINNIGISTFLYFQTIKNLVILLLILGLVFSIYTIIIDAMRSLAYQDQSVGQNAFMALSIAARKLLINIQKQNPGTVPQYDQLVTETVIQCWIGMAVVLIWVLTIFIMKYFEKQNEVKVEEQTISASDFSIVIEGIPKDATKEQLQAQLSEYEKTITNVPARWKRPFTISKFNMGKPFYLNPQNFKDQQVEKMKERLQELTDIFVGWVEQRQDSPTFSSTKQERQAIYTEYNQILKKIEEKYKQLGEKVQEQMKKENSETISTAFVTFSTSNAMKIVTRLNDPSFSSKLRYYLTCCQAGNRFKFVRNQQDQGITIQRAPQPEDIKWQNLGVEEGEIFKRKLLTYLVTLVLLGISFAAVYGLSQAQIQNQQDTYLSVLISVIISLINIIIGQVIRRLSIYEMDYTETNHQTSLALKSILAQLINSILTPTIVASLIKQNLYGIGGLADDIFMLGITNSFISPAVKVFQPGFIINRILKWFKCQPNNKLKSNQQLLNDTCQFIIFETGYQYIYIVNLFLFSCFFAPLQPIVPIFAVFGMGLMYWAQKYTIFNRMQRPVPGTDLINIAMWQIILAGGIFYAFGSLLFSNIILTGAVNQALVPNIIAMVLGVIMFLMPYRAIFVLIFDEQDLICHQYDKSRLLFPSEYDRLNPLTQKEGFQEYMEFLKKAQQDYNNASEEEKKKMQKKFAAQGARGQQRNKPMIGGFGSSNPFMPPPQLAAPGMMRPAFGMPMMMARPPPPMMMRPPPQHMQGPPPQMQGPPQQMQGPPQQMQGPPPQQQINQGPPPPQRPPAFNPPGMMQGPPGFGRPPPGFGAPPPGFGRFGGFGAPPPGFGGHSAFGVPPPGFGGRR